MYNTSQVLPYKSDWHNMMINDVLKHGSQGELYVYSLEKRPQSPYLILSHMIPVGCVVYVILDVGAFGAETI